MLRDERVWQDRVRYHCLAHRTRVLLSETMHPPWGVIGILGQRLSNSEPLGGGRYCAGVWSGVGVVNKSVEVAFCQFPNITVLTRSIRRRLLCNHATLEKETKKTNKEGGGGEATPFLLELRKFDGWFSTWIEPVSQERRRRTCLLSRIAKQCAVKVVAAPPASAWKFCLLSISLLPQNPVRLTAVTRDPLLFTFPTRSLCLAVLSLGSLVPPTIRRYREN